MEVSGNRTTRPHSVLLVEKELGPGKSHAPSSSSAVVNSRMVGGHKFSCNNQGPITPDTKRLQHNYWHKNRWHNA